MKVLWLAPLPYIDDNKSHPAAWVITLALALVEKGIKLTIINYNSQIKDAIDIKYYQGIELVYIKTPNTKIDLLSLFTKRIDIVKRYLKSIEANYDILHIHGTEHQYEVMANDLNIPKVISIQGIMNEYIKIYPVLSNIKQYISWKISCYYEKKYMKYYKYFSCRTHWDTNYIKNNVSNAKIFTIWEMIRDPFFNVKVQYGNKNILFVGGKNPIKGLKELLFAYNDSTIQDLGCGLIILGNCDKNDVIKIINKHKLTNINLSNIEVRGMQNAVGMIEAYKECFCLVHPTYIDNSPNSICEAQLAGLPVIATNVGGVATLIDNNITGLLVNRNDQNGLKDAIVKIFENKLLWMNISEASKNISNSRHDSNTIVNQTMKMYKKIIKDCSDVQ